MLTRALLALPLLLAACAPVGSANPTPAEAGVTFSELPGEVRIEGYWDEFYQFAYVFVEYGGPNGTYGIRDEEGCYALAFDAEVEGGRFNVTSGEPQPGGFEDGECIAPRVIIERIDSPLLSLTLRDAAGDEIHVEWRDVGVRRSLEFELEGDTLTANEEARLVGPLPGDTWESGREVSLSWFADDGPDSYTLVFVDSEVVDGGVVFTVPPGIPDGVEVDGMVEGPLFNAVERCEGVARCEFDVGFLDSAEAVAGPPS